MARIRNHFIIQHHWVVCFKGLTDGIKNAIICRRKSQVNIVVTRDDDDPIPHPINVVTSPKRAHKIQCQTFVRQCKLIWATAVRHVPSKHYQLWQRGAVWSQRIRLQLLSDPVFGKGGFWVRFLISKLRIGE